MGKLSISDSLSISIDISDSGDTTVMQVVRFTGNKCEVINTLYGEEALWTYEHLINKPGAPDSTDDQPHRGLTWMKANPAILEQFKPEFLGKSFHFTGENPMLTCFSLPQKPWKTSPDQMLIDQMITITDEMYPKIKLNPEGGTH